MYSEAVLRRAVLAAAFAAPLPAWAHSPVPGIEGFYGALALPLREPGLGLAAICLALLLMHDFPDRFARGWKLYVLAAFAGLIAARPLVATVPAEPALLALAATAGGLVALAGDRLTPVALLLTPLIGLAIGAAALPEPGPTRAVVLTTAGALVGAHLPMLVLCGAIDWLREKADGPPLRIGLRVAASWLAALSILMLALVLRPA